MNSSIKGNTFIAGATGSGKSFLLSPKANSERTMKAVSATSTIGRAAKVFKNKARIIQSFAGPW